MIYAISSRDDPADCSHCGGPLAGDNNTSICYKCTRILSYAAPELLEACKAAHNLISYMHIKAYDRASAGEVLGKLNLAIERAEVRND